MYKYIYRSQAQIKQLEVFSWSFIYCGKHAVAHLQKGV